MINKKYKVEIFKHTIIVKTENMELTQPLPKDNDDLNRIFNIFGIDCSSEANIPTNQEELSLFLQKYGIEYEYFDAELFETTLEKQKDGSWKRIVVKRK